MSRGEIARSWGDRGTVLMGTGVWSKMPGIQRWWWLWNIVNTLRTLDLTFYLKKNYFCTGSAVLTIGAPEKSHLGLSF